MADDRIISTGRGGAGNVRSPKKVDEPDTSAALPKIQGKRFTTGRGGAGNMMDNIDPDSTRAAQDESSPDLPVDRVALAPTTSSTVGRGGYGNNIRGMRSRQYRQDTDDGEEGGQKSFCARLTSLVQ